MFFFSMGVFFSKGEAKSFFFSNFLRGFFGTSFFKKGCFFLRDVFFFQREVDFSKGGFFQRFFFFLKKKGIFF